MTFENTIQLNPLQIHFKVLEKSYFNDNKHISAVDYNIVKLLCVQEIFEEFYLINKDTLFMFPF